MATELGSAYISVGLGTNSLAGDIKKAFGSAEGSGSSAGKAAGKGFGLGFAGIATAALGGFGLGSFFKSAVSGAGDLEQSVGAVDSVFKGSAGQMHEWAKSAATDVGLTQNEFNQLGTLIGSQLKNGGTAMDQLGPKTKALIATGADLASMFGGTTQEAVDALSSALKGERDPIEKYGVSLTQAKIDAEAAALGFKKVGGALSAEATQAATVSLIMKQTTDAHGNFGRETDTLAHKQQVLSAQWADGKAQLGSAFLPAVAAATGALSKALGPAMSGAVSGAKELVGGFTAMGAAFKAGGDDVTSSGFAGVMERVGLVARHIFDGVAPVVASLAASFAPLIPQVLSLLSAFSPLGLVFKAIQPILPQLLGLFAQLGSVIAGTLSTTLTALMPIVSAFVAQLSSMAVQVMPAVAQIVGLLGAALTTLAPVIAQVLAQVAPLVLSLMSQLAPIITSLVTTILPPLVSIFGNIVTAIGPLVSMIMGLLIPVIQALMPVVVTVFGVIANVITSAMQIVQGIIQVVTGLITGNWSQVWEGIQNVFSGIWNTIVAVVGGAIGIVWSSISAGLGLIGGFVGTVLGNIGRFFSDTWNNVIGGVSRFIGGFIGFFRDLPGKAVAAISGLAGQMLTVGQNIVQGLIDGARGMIDRAVQTVKDIGGSMLKGIQDFLGIHSPSREFMKIGGWVTVGLAEGVRKKAPVAVKAIRDVAQRLTDAATSHWKKAASSTGNAHILEILQATQLDRAAASVRAQVGTLTKLTKQRDALSAQLSASQKRLSAAVTTRNKQATDSTGKLRDEFKLSDMVGLNASSIKQLADATAAQLKGFAGKISKLRGLGLNAQLIQQIGDLGSRDGGALADSLIAGGKGAVSGINGSFKTIGTYAQQAGNQIADGMYGAGINGLKGLVSGFSGNLKAVDQAAKKVTDRITSQVKKNLGIHSPSRVFRNEVGQQVGEGARLGILDKVKAVANAADQLVRVPSVPSFLPAAYQPVGVGGAGAGFNNYGTIHVRDENEMARIITTRQRDAQVAYGF